MQTPLDLPSDLATAHAMIVAERAARTAVEQLRTAERLLIEKLQLEIARLKREKHGASSERSARLEQLELTLEDLQETLAEATVAAEVAVAAVGPVQVEGFERRRPARRPLPEHLPRQRVVLPNPIACPCCGGTRLSKIGEDLGHQRCGAVAAACDVVKKKTRLPGSIGPMVAAITPAARAVEVSGSDFIDATVRENARRQAAAIRDKSEIVRHLESDGKVKIVYARYDLDSGVVDFLGQGRPVGRK